MNTTAIIIPVKFQSRRVVDKNLRLIDGKPLYKLIVEEITSKENDWDIFVYSNNVRCLKGMDARVKYLPRPKYLDGDAVRANELFGYATEILPHEVHAIVHPTCPFLTFETINSCIEAVEQGGYDSSFSAERIQRYAWYEGKPLNYNPINMVQTQELVPILLENSGIYAYTKKGYIERGTRIGIHPFIKEVSNKEVIDIDTEDEFELAKTIAENKIDKEKKIYIDSMICKEKFPKVENLIFDFDGVLGDTIRVMEQAWGSMCMELKDDIKIPNFENYRKYIGKPFNDILHDIGVDKKDWEIIRKLYFAGTTKESSNIRLYEGIYDLLLGLKGENKNLSIYTSKPFDSLNNIKAYKNIENLFDTVLTADTLPIGMKGKPSGDGLECIISKANMNKLTTLYIGDTYSDALEAKNARCNFIRAEWAGHKDQNYLENEILVFTPMHMLDIITK